MGLRAFYLAFIFFFIVKNTGKTNANLETSKSDHHGMLQVGTLYIIDKNQIHKRIHH